MDKNILADYIDCCELLKETGKGHPAPPEEKENHRPDDCIREQSGISV